MRVEIISYGHGMLRGKLHSQYLESPYEFFNFIRMLEKMEEVFDSKGFPERFLLPRNFSGTKRGRMKRDTERNDAMKDPINPINTDKTVDSKCTFEVTVRFRQNATWQGQILWAEKNKKQNFRSVLEMLKLMDEALSNGEVKTKQIEWKEPEH